MPINIYSVQDHLESEGWGLISDEYINLKSPLKIICPNGHIQEQSYDDWRKYKTCSVCFAGDNKKFRKNSVPEKGNAYRILALDAATRTSGYAIFDDKDLVAYGVFDADTKKDLTGRINEVKQWLEGKIEDWKPDFVGVEDIQLQQNVEMFKALAKLQGVLLETLYENDIPHDLVYSGEWRKTCGITGGGRENKKKAAQDKVLEIFNRKCTQDEADAICIGKHFTMVNTKSLKNDMKEGFFGV